MSEMLSELRGELEKRAEACDPGPQYEGETDPYYSRADMQDAKVEAFRESIEIAERVVEKHTRRCTAVIWHGPGHQSKTKCQRRGPHDVHSAVYGAMNQEAEWRGDEAMTGFFDEPPSDG